MTTEEGIRINAYVSAMRLSPLGKRTIQLDIPEDQSIQFMAAMSLYGKFVEIKIREIGEPE